MLLAMVTLEEMRMFELPMADLIGRVLLTRERVKFHQADPGCSEPPAPATPVP